MRLRVDGFGSIRDGWDWFIAGPIRDTKREAKEDLRKLKAELAAAKKTKQQRDDLLAALKEVVAISDRKHDAWDRAHTAIANAEQKP